MKQAKQNNIGKKSAALILVIIIAAVLILLLFQYFFLRVNNRNHAYRIGEMLSEQIGNILISNDRKQQVLTETLKESYITKAKAVSHFIDRNPNAETNIDDLLYIKQLLLIDEIHLFTDEGEIYFGTVPQYYGYSFDSGEQMGYFKPMLTDKTLSMCQDVTPNTAENKSMMYAICWSDDGSRMVQVGIEPVRLLEELHANEIDEVVDALPVYAGISIFAVDNQTNEIVGSSLPGLVEKDLNEIGLKAPFGNEAEKTAKYSAVLQGDNVYCFARKADKYTIIVTQTEKEANRNVPELMSIVCIYLLIASLVIIFITKKLTEKVINEKRNADTDAMTGLQNRRAYEDAVLHFEKFPEEKGSDFVCVVFDINELKMINDRYGHDAGDKAIKAFAKIIDRNFGPYGDVYRIGGDEFAAFVYLDSSQLEQLISQSVEELSEWTAKNQVSLSMSHGAVFASEFPEAGVQELIKIADERMYDAKAAYYQQTGHDRRQNKGQGDNHGLFVHR